MYSFIALKNKESSGLGIWQLFWLATTWRKNYDIVKRIFRWILLADKMFKKSQQYFTNSKETSHTPHGKGCEFESDLSFSNEEQKAVRDYPTELKFSLVAFCFSLIIVCGKLVIINSKYNFCLFDNTFLKCNEQCLVIRNSSCAFIVAVREAGTVFISSVTHS